MPEQRVPRPVLDAPVSGGDETATSPPAGSRWTALAAAMERAVRRVCPAWLSDHADDIVQAALMKVMAAERHVEGERLLSAFYLRRAAHSALVDEIRRRRRRSEVSWQAPGDQAGDEPRVEPRAQGDPESHAAFRELGTAVRDCLLTARRERRLAVTLYLKGHSVQEAASILGWETKRTENLVYRGLADLRQCLMGEGHRP